MKIICLYLVGNYEDVLQQIAETIPCFIWYENDGSVAINCREEDAAFVEISLRDFV